MNNSNSTEVHNKSLHLKLSVRSLSILKINKIVSREVLKGSRGTKEASYCFYISE